jgi:excisionase family DNA binding protein
MTPTETASLADHVWLTTKEASAYSKRSIVTIHRHAAAGTLQSTSGGRGRHRLFRREWIDAWLEADQRLPAARTG